MQWKISKVYYYLILFLIILNSKVFLFGDWDSEIRYITALLSTLMFLSMFFYNGNVKKFYLSTNICIWIILFYTFLIVDSVYSIYVHGVSISYILGQVYIYLYLLLIFPIEYIFFKNRKYFNKIIYYLSLWGGISLLVRIFVWFLYNYLHIDFMHFLVFEAGYDWIRDGKQRIPLTNLAAFTLSYSLFSLYKKNFFYEKLKYIFLILILFFYAQEVVDARSVVLRLVLILSIIILLNSKNKVTSFMKSLFFLYLIIILLISGVFLDFYNSIDRWSIVARMQAIQYYWGLFKEHFFSGVNLISESQTLQHGIGNNFYFADLGIISKFVEYGFVGGVIFLYPIFILIKESLCLLKENDSIQIFSTCLILYIVSGCFLSSDIYFVREIFILPFTLAILDYKKKSDSQSSTKI